MYHETGGAYTGELSRSDAAGYWLSLRDPGPQRATPHSGETNEAVCRKVHAAFAAGLIPIVCVGETLQQREAGKTSDIVAEQFFGSLAGVPADQASRVVIAYEPVWAIGTGVNASPEQARKSTPICAGSWQAVTAAAVADQIRIQYGGSVKADNAAELLAKSDIDGALVGGASLQAAGFAKIVHGSHFLGMGVLKRELTR
jgi:triosephosphate isomerase (TIM)